MYIIYICVCACGKNIIKEAQLTYRSIKNKSQFTYMGYIKKNMCVSINKFRTHYNKY